MKATSQPFNESRELSSIDRMNRTKRMRKLGIIWISVHRQLKTIVFTDFVYSRTERIAGTFRLIKCQRLRTQYSDKERTDNGPVAVLCGDCRSVWGYACTSVVAQ